MGASFKIAPDEAGLIFDRDAFFHSANQPKIQKKLREKIKLGDQVHRDDNCQWKTS